MHSCIAALLPVCIMYNSFPRNFSSTTGSPPSLAPSHPHQGLLLPATFPSASGTTPSFTLFHSPPFYPLEQQLPGHVMSVTSAYLSSSMHPRNSSRIRIPGPELVAADVLERVGARLLALGSQLGTELPRRLCRGCLCSCLRGVVSFQQPRPHSIQAHDRMVCAPRQQPLPSFSPRRAPRCLPPLRIRPVSVVGHRPFSVQKQMLVRRPSQAGLASAPTPASAPGRRRDPGQTCRRRCPFISGCLLLL